MSEWISVKDRLPPMAEQCDNEADVLLFIPQRDGCKQNGIYLGCRRPFVINGNIVAWTVWAWHYWEDPVVSHWMPLPDPPKEVQENEQP